MSRAKKHYYMYMCICIEQIIVISDKNSKIYMPLLTTQQDKEPTITTLYHYKAWKKDHGHLDVPSLLKLMGYVHRSHQGSRRALMVMCE